MDPLKKTELDEALDENIMRLVKRRYSAVQPRDEFLGETLDHMYAWQDELVARRTVARTPARRRLSFAPLLLRGSVAAALLLAGVGAWLLIRGLADRRAGALGVHIVASGAEATVTHGRRVIDAVEGTRLRVGDMIETGSSSSMTLRYRDSTEVTLEARTKFRIVAYGGGGAEESPGAHGKRWRCLSGVVHATVAPQPHNRPAIVDTPHAHAVIAGTTFSLIVDAERTQIDVAHGSVRVRSASGGPMVLAPAGRRVVTEGASDLVVGARRPENAIVLFDGADTSEWMCHDSMRIPTERQVFNASPCHFPVKNGALEACYGGHLVTKRMFRDFRLYAEFRVPIRENVDSGIWFQFRHGIEIGNQSSENVSSGLGWAIYKEPIARAGKPDGAWQSLEVIYKAARFDEKGAKIESARLTAFLNGIKIHDNVELTPSLTGLTEPDGPGPGPIVLDAYDPRSYGAQFRNIWIVPLQGRS